jgi:uncharacterized protein (TIGR02217 family)
MFHDISAPNFLSKNAKGGPKFFTSVITLNYKHELRRLITEEPKCFFSIDLSSLTQQNYDELNAFFRARKGTIHSFKFRDLCDDKVTESKLIKISDNKYHIYKIYTDGSFETLKHIKYPIQSTIKIHDANNKIYSYTFDKKDFSIILENALSDDLYIDCFYEIEVRFNNDMLNAIKHPSGYQVTHIELVEI